jgi:hypothetical protein
MRRGWRLMMKKVTLILPDTILHTLGSSRWTKTEEIELTPANLMRFLQGSSDYHESFRMDTSKVEILSIEAE